MKKEMILEKWKTKTISLLMAGIMVFAMAPLGTAVAFADEENGNALENNNVNAEDIVVDDLFEQEEPAVQEEPAIDEEETVVQAAAAVNAGYHVIDLSKGPKTFHVDMNNLGSSTDPATVEVISLLNYLAIFSNQGEDSLGYLNYTPDPNNRYLIHLDLDKNGSTDVDIRAIVNGTVTDADGNEQPSVNGMTFEQAKTTSVYGTKTFTLPNEYLAYFKEDPYCEKYYTGLKFVLGKKANTLTLKAKKMTKIKARKMKKKAQSFNLSKFVTISGAQGPVTYAKASGNKKITVSKTGKVTLKKKIKKGTYKVKVNVTAAGNTNFNAVTKAVTFKVKVK